ncbi:MAG: beta-ketoacyl-[acyl-carrier-protein] synthase family protein [Candidatus Aminicenantes bacterium]|nr:MAG: beta-ketoacyl-[acyl-carrier-protein] synthase family protein [Candidatus Aminicenantes bacterium]
MSKKSGRRVVVTGIGEVTPLNPGAQEKTAWESMKQGKSGIGYITKLDHTTFPVHTAGEIKNFKLQEDLKKKLGDLEPYLYDCGRFLLSAAYKALQDAQLHPEHEDPSGIGAIVGISGNDNHDLKGDRLLDYYLRMKGKGAPGNHPGICSRHETHGFITRDNSNFVKILAELFQLKGVVHTINTACAAGAQSVGEAYHLIKYGIQEVMIVGGVDSLLDLVPITGLGMLGSLSPAVTPDRASRPFDAKRDGFVLSEGSSILVVEEMNRAMQRKAPIYGEIIGYGCSMNAFRLTELPPDGKRGKIALEKAIEDADIRLDQIDYINAHGTSTVQNDVIETMILKEVFGDHIYNIPITANKSMMGHIISACGASEAINTLMSIKEQYICPTINYEDEDPRCDLDYTPNKGRHHTINIGMSNSFGFGGQNAVLLFQKVDF